MALIQNEGRDAALDRVTRKLVVHCGLHVDNLPATEHAARAELAGRLLDAVGGDEAAVDLTAPEFADELHRLSVQKTLT